MRFVVFENKGVLDPRAITTFGVSVKETDNPIGYFGTGLKYAIAILMRQKLTAKLITGMEQLNFECKTVTVRGKPFEMITMGDKEMPFTTHLGVNWQTWQAFRELYCNCLDEGGRVYMTDLLPLCEEDKTFFVVGGQEFEQLYHDRDEIVLNLPKSLLLHEGTVDIYRRPSKHLYYRGIKVYQFEVPSLYTYNLNAETQLTEDRTLKYPDVAMHNLPKEVARMTDKAVIRSVLTAQKGTLEQKFSFVDLKYSVYPPSDEFTVVLAEEYNSNNDRLNNTARDFFQHWQRKYSPKNMDVAVMSIVEEKMLRRATEVVKKLYPDFEYPITVVKTLGQETMAMAEVDERRIVLSKVSFKLGTKFLVSTLIEEYVHIKYGYRDCTRDMQTHLFDTIATMTEEHILREPI